MPGCVSGRTRPRPAARPLGEALGPGLTLSFLFRLAQLRRGKEGGWQGQGLERHRLGQKGTYTFTDRNTGRDNESLLVCKLISRSLIYTDTETVNRQRTRP